MGVAEFFLLRSHLRAVPNPGRHTLRRCPSEMAGMLSGSVRMELRDIETFLVLAEELHFRHAAERLYLSPGRVSQTVQAMEKELGGPLFTRNSRKVQLTRLGEKFRAEAAPGFASIRGAVARTKAMAVRRRAALRIGYCETIDGEVVADLIAACRLRHPDLPVTAVALFTDNAFHALRDHDIDLLLTWSPGGDASAVTDQSRDAGPVLARAWRAALVPAGHALAVHSEISIEQVAYYGVLDVLGGAPSGFRHGWTPPRTLSGKPLRRHAGNVTYPTVDVETLLACLVRDRLVHLTIGSLLESFPYPGLMSIPVRDLPPCVLVPVWQTGFDTETTRAFVAAAAHHSKAPPSSAMAATN